jgi:xanthine dehydrogenase YagR molybdenum-binding subunit
VYEVCVALREQLQNLARNQTGSAFSQVPPTDLVALNGELQLAQDSSKRLSYVELLRQQNLPMLEVTRQSKGGPELKEHSGKSFCANFVEVHVHALTGEVRVNRVVSVVDAGRVLNHTTARSQVLGAVVWGIGQALMEQAVIDHRYGNFINHDLAEYHVPVNADMPAIDVQFIDKPDPIISPTGAKGLGEIGLVGFAAAVANAVYHATGTRVRELPITPDKLV